jgi:ABC-type sugar transport system ATPase subunit
MGEIVLREVSKSFGNVHVVHDLTFTVDDGEFATLLGPSGCGKSTTLNLIAGLEDLTSGTITINDRRVDDLPPDKRDLAFVFQDYALYPHKTVFENLAFGLRMRRASKTEIAERVNHAARTLSIDHLLDRKPRALSGGQRQRVALGRAMARHPSVFLFDEPLSNLDALLRDQTRSEIKRLHQELGATSVYVTHDQEEAMTLSDRIAVMNQGRLEQYGTPEEVYHRPATEFVAGFVGKPRMNLYRMTRLDGARFSGTSSQFVIGANVDGESITVGVRPEDLRISTPASDGDMQGSVRLVEPLGAATDIVVEVDDVTFTVRLPGLSRLQVQEKVGLSLADAPLHFFDARTGRRLN